MLPILYAGFSLVNQLSYAEVKTTFFINSIEKLAS